MCVPPCEFGYCLSGSAQCQEDPRGCRAAFLWGVCGRSTACLWAEGREGAVQEGPSGGNKRCSIVLILFVCNTAAGPRPQSLDMLRDQGSQVSHFHTVTTVHFDLKETQSNCNCTTRRSLKTLLLNGRHIYVTHAALSSVWLLLLSYISTLCLSYCFSL